MHISKILTDPKIAAITIDCRSRKTTEAQANMPDPDVARLETDLEKMTLKHSEMAAAELKAREEIREKLAEIKR